MGLLPPTPTSTPGGGNQITKKWGNVGRKRKRNRTEVAFPGLGPGEGRPWNLFRKPSNQLAMFLDVFFSPHYSSLFLYVFTIISVYHVAV